MAKIKNKHFIISYLKNKIAFGLINIIVYVQCTYIIFSLCQMKSNNSNKNNNNDDNNSNNNNNNNNSNNIYKKRNNNNTNNIKHIDKQNRFIG